MRRLTIRMYVAVLLALYPGAGALAQSGPSYDAATIKPSNPEQTGQHWHSESNRTSMGHVTLRQLIKVAYGFRSDSQVIDGPEWMTKAHFDISARMDDQEYARFNAMKGTDQEKESNLLLQQLLVDRFGLRVRLETHPLPQFALVVDGAASKLTPVSDAGGDNSSVHNGNMTAKGVHMDLLAAMLSDMPEVNDRVVVNRTGLMGAYNFELHWTPERSSTASEDATLPGLFTALREQLGLKLERGEGEVPVAVVEKAELPQFD